MPWYRITRILPNGDQDITETDQDKIARQRVKSILKDRHELKTEGVPDLMLQGVKDALGIGNRSTVGVQ
jgi:hypothetical protein